MDAERAAGRSVKRYKEEEEEKDSKATSRDNEDTPNENQAF